MKKIGLISLVALACSGLLPGCYSMPFKPATFSQATDSMANYRFDTLNVPDSGTAYHYIKSNQDGSNAAEEWNYIVSPAQTESFKIYTFSKFLGRTDLVTADYDPHYFSTKNTNSWLLTADGRRTLNYGTRTTAGFQVSDGVQPSSNQVQIGHVPCYNYNFDWCDFAFMYHHLINKDASFVVGVTSVTSDFHLLYAGTAQIDYQGRVDYHGHTCRRYQVSGEAFGQASGWLYTDIATNIVVELDMPVRDNPTFASFKYSLIDSFVATPEQWADFVLLKTRQLLGK